MAKLKKAKLSMNNKEKSFAFEIMGIVSILISLISIARFGLIGKYLVLAFSLLFGDWYFVFIGIVGVFGVYCLVFHKKIEIKSVRYYGIFLILLSLLIVTHFGMHEYVSQFEGNALKTTLRIYFDYFKSNSTMMIKGGGVIGCIFFYLFYFLLGKVGTVLISLILMFVGIVFLTKKTIREFIEMIIKFVKKIYLFFQKKFKNVIESVVEISKDYVNKKPLKEKVNKIFIKKEKEVDGKKEIENCESNVEILKDSLKHLDIELVNITYLICEHIIVYFIKTKEEVNYRVLEYSLAEKLNENFLLKYDKINDQLLLEINKKEPNCLTLKRALKVTTKNSLFPVIGIDDRNLIVELDSNLLIIGKNKDFVTRYLMSIIFYFKSLRKYKNEKITLINCYNTNMSNYFLDIITDLDYLENIVREIDLNLELLNLHHKKDIDEYNLFYQKKIKKKWYFILGIENIVYKKGYFDKLLYIVQTGHLGGINVILTISENVSLSNVLQSSIDKKVILDNDFDFANHLVDNSYFEILNNNIEGFYKERDLIIRIALLCMDDEEWEKNIVKEKTS